ncbi:MAG TPA: adenylosuccinate synthase [Thermomicrobiales bacterium]|nr:adenylosuccinate synthase [Thermomicrobiales bacterium]
MPATIIMGGQWGDEGKGKLTDALAAEAHVVVRANGGSNAGHTVETDQGVFKFHLIPSGILNPDCHCIVGAGVVVNPFALVEEMEMLEGRGVALSNLRLSDRAHLVLPYHPRLDQLEESERQDDELGTTLTGNGPAYADKVSRHGLRVADLLDGPSLRRKLDREVAAKNRILTELHGQEPIDAEDLYRRLLVITDRIQPHIAPSEVLVQSALDEGRSILVECAQGAMLDIDYGTYPFVTSSSPTAAGACQGAGIAPTRIDHVVAVFKAYSTRVGTGPLPTELHDATGDTIRERGKEYGTTTGRPRRTGWFDAVAARHIVRLNGVTEVTLTLLDVLDVFPTISVCTEYHVGGSRLNHIPARGEVLSSTIPHYVGTDGWLTDISGVREQEDLPAEAIAYVHFLEEALGAPITRLGVGPGREQLVSMGGAAARTLSHAR